MKFQFVLIPEDLARTSVHTDGGLNVAFPGLALTAILLASCGCLWTCAYPPLAAIVVIVVTATVVGVGWRVRKVNRLDALDGAFAADSPWRTVEIGDEFVSQATPLSETRVPWPKVRLVELHPTHVVIWTAPNSGFFIPGRAVADRAAMASAFRRHVGERVKIVGCPNCGYDASASSSRRCPECGVDFGSAA